MRSILGYWFMNFITCFRGVIMFVNDQTTLEMYIHDTECIISVFD